MFKRNKEKLKDEIKKDLLKEIGHSNKKNEVIVQKKTGISYQPVVEHSKEELVEIRKSFLNIFIFSIILFIGLIIAVCFNDVMFKNDRKTNAGEDISIEEEVIDIIYSSLDKLSNGVVSTSNKALLSLFDEVNFKSRELYTYDSTYLYSKDELLVSDMDSSYLLFLLTKTDTFVNYIKDNGMLTKYEICNKDGSIKILYDDISDMINTEFGVNLKEKSDFIYTHYVDGTFSAYIKFVYSDGYYVSSCFDISLHNYKATAKVYISDAYKSDSELKINVSVAFSNGDGLYADYGRNLLLVEGTNYDIFQYLPYASKYEFVYLLGTNNNYYLSKVVKINTTE